MGGTVELRSAVVALTNGPKQSWTGEGGSTARGHGPSAPDRATRSWTAPPAATSDPSVQAQRNTGLRLPRSTCGPRLLLRFDDLTCRSARRAVPSAPREEQLHYARARFGLRRLPPREFVAPPEQLQPAVGVLYQSRAMIDPVAGVVAVEDAVLLGFAQRRLMRVAANHTVELAAARQAEQHVLVVRQVL